MIRPLSTFVAHPEPWSLVAAPVVAERPEMFMLGSSHYGQRFAAVNGMSAVFAHRVSPDLAFEVLRDYRRDFTPRAGRAHAYSAMSVLAFASDDDEAVLEFEAAWALTLQNISRAKREALRPEEVRAFAQSEAFRGSHRDDTRMVTGSAKVVAERLLEMKELAQVDELVVVTPSLGRQRRKDSYLAAANPWRLAM